LFDTESLSEEHFRPKTIQISINSVAKPSKFTFSQRADRGALWENYFVNERRRLHAYTNSGTQSYFWRTYDQQELDLIEVHPGGTLSAFECKWQNKKHRSPKAWQKAYPDTPVQLVHPHNYTEFLL